MELIYTQGPDATVGHCEIYWGTPKEPYTRADFRPKERMDSNFEPTPEFRELFTQIKVLLSRLSQCIHARDGKQGILSSGETS
jgi:hypothetical protein